MPEIEKLPPRVHKRYGWHPSLPDARDKIFSPKALDMAIPPRIDLRETGWLPPIYDQGNLGSCTANGTAAMVEYLLGKEKEPEFTPSRLFIYYNERYIEGTVDSDSGAMVRDGLKVLAKYGFPNENDWPYDIDKFAVQPPESVYTEARRDRVLQYSGVSRPNVGSTKVRVKPIQRALAQLLSVVFGFTVYENFEDTGSDGIVPLPAGEVLGGHCVLAVGYKQINSGLYFIVRNSWGEWADHGYCYMPARILADEYMSDDFWCAQLVGK